MDRAANATFQPAPFPRCHPFNHQQGWAICRDFCQKKVFQTGIATGKLEQGEVLKWLLLAVFCYK